MYMGMQSAGHSEARVEKGNILSAAVGQVIELGCAVVMCLSSSPLLLLLSLLLLLLLLVPVLLSLSTLSSVTSVVTVEPSRVVSMFSIVVAIIDKLTKK